MINAAAAQVLTTAQATGGSAASNAKSPGAGAGSASSAADARLAAEKDALSRLEAVSASAKASPSELAKTKLNALKERLKMLMMLGGDPKTVAKEAAQIAKEIGAAAKEYADSAGGSDSGSSAEASSATSAAQQAAAAAQGVAVAPEDANASAAPADAPDADPAKGDAAPTDRSQAKDSLKAQTPNQPPVPQTATAVGKSKQPDPVIEEARVLEASAKAIAKAAMEKLKAQHRDNPDAKTEQANLDQGQKDFDTAAKEIYGDTGTPSGGGGDALASYAADGSGAAAAANAPLVSVKA